MTERIPEPPTEEPALHVWQVNVDYVGLHSTTIRVEATSQEAAEADAVARISDERGGTEIEIIDVERIC